MDIETTGLGLLAASGAQIPQSLRRSFLRIAEYPVEIITSNAKQMDYTLSVIYPHTRCEERLPTRCKILCLADHESAFVQLVLADSSREIIDKGEISEYGKLSSGLAYVLPNSHLFANFILEDCGNVLLISTGPHAEWGATSFLRAALLRQYGKSPDTIAFHAASLEHRLQRCGIVISTAGYVGDPSREKERKKGKTTTLLGATATDRESWAIYSNDEVIVSLSRDAVRCMPLPAEVVVRSGTLDGLRRFGMSPQLVDGFEALSSRTGEPMYATTNKSLAEAGFTITPTLPNMAAWVFIDLEPDRNFYETTQLGLQKAFELFCMSIYRRRMGEFRSDIWMPEFDISRFVKPLQPTDFVNARKLFCKLLDSGTGFFLIRGGVDYPSLSRSLKELIR